MLPTDPSHLAVANIDSVSNENVVPSPLCRLSESDAVSRDLVCDIGHSLQDDPPVLLGEGVVELELQHPTRPQSIRVGKRRVLSCF